MQLFHSSQVRDPRPGQSGGQGFSPAGQTQARGRGVLAAAWPLCQGVSTLEKECRHWRSVPPAQAALERAICFSRLISVILAFTKSDQVFWGSGSQAQSFMFHAKSQPYCYIFKKAFVPKFKLSQCKQVALTRF